MTRGEDHCAGSFEPAPPVCKFIERTLLDGSLFDEPRNPKGFDDQVFQQRTALSALLEMVRNHPLLWEVVEKHVDFTLGGVIARHREQQTAQQRTQQQPLPSPVRHPFPAPPRLNGDDEMTRRRANAGAHLGTSAPQLASVNGEGSINDHSE